MDITQFSTASDWYDYDGTASSTSFGSLFDTNGLFVYEGHQCCRPNLAGGSVTRSLLHTMLERYVNTIGFSGFWWRGLLCLRLLSRECEQGEGTDNRDAISFLRSLSSEQWIQFGEDTRGEVIVKNASSLIQNIADSVTSRGLGYDGQVNANM